MSEKSRTGIVLVAFLLLISAQFALVSRQVLESHNLADSPVSFGALEPIPCECVPGGLVHFKYTREVNLLPRELPVILLTTDNFENIETGEVYPGATIVRLINSTRGETVNTVRAVPNYLPPGTYFLSGWAQSYTKSPSRPTYYASRTFVIKPNPPE